MRLAWITDPHFDHTTRDRAVEVLSEVNQSADALVITGDIAESNVLELHLKRICATSSVPVYFILGNHDFYHGSIYATRYAVSEICSRCSDKLVYLSASGVRELTPTTGLIGIDGWADGRLGNFLGSGVWLNDYRLIRELVVAHTKPELLSILNLLGDQQAAELEPKLEEAVQRYPQVICATHVPPFREACWWEGKNSDANWLPHFSCKAVGDVMVRVMKRYSDRQLLVLCGHTHGEGEAQILPNLRVLTGKAEYGYPWVQRVLDVV